MHLDRREKRERLVGITRGLIGCQGRATLGQCSGFVEGDYANFLQALKCVPLAEENPKFRRACCQIGALSFVPKRCRLEGDSVYVGIPVKKK